VNSRDTAAVFVVEDDATTRGKIMALLSKAGIPSEAFVSAEEFLEDAREQRPGCILAGLRLRGMDGIEFHRRLVETGIETPVILFSATFSVRIVIDALRQGVFDVLESPHRDDELLDAVRSAIEFDRALRRRRLRRLEIQQQWDSLTTRERQALELILAGQANKTIERRLGISRRTVERTRASILSKMKASSFVELAAVLAKAGIWRGAAEEPAVEPDTFEHSLHRRAGLPGRTPLRRPMHGPPASLTQHT